MAIKKILKKFQKIIARGSSTHCFFPIKKQIFFKVFFFPKVAKKEFLMTQKKNPHHFTLTLLLF